jgi:hypothetical protein
MKQLFIAFLCMFLILQCHSQLTVQRDAGLYLQEGSVITLASIVYLQKGVTQKNLSVAGFAKGYYNISVEFAGMKNSLKLVRQ